MKKAVIVLCMAGLVSGFASLVWASGIDNKQNFSADYIAAPSRNGAINGADIAAYNPAGIMQMENGLLVAVNAQIVSINYDHNIESLDHGADGTPIVPSVFGIYKQNRWAAFGSFTINGGGGTAEYENGNIINKTIGNLAAMGAFTDPGYSLFEARTGTSRPDSAQLMPGGVFTSDFAGVDCAYYTLTAGTAWAVNDIFSVSAALRYITTKKEVDIHGTYTAPGDSARFVLGKFEQDAQGWGGVFGMNLRPSEKVNIGLRYETRVNLDWHTDIDSESRGSVGENLLWMNSRVDGKSYARDLPAVFALGVQWNLTRKLSVSPSYTLYLEKDADWGADQNRAKKDNSYDLGISLGYMFNDKFSASIGYMYTAIGMDPDDFGLIEKMSPPLDCHSIGLGGKYTINEKITFSTGVMGCFYVSQTAGATAITPAVEYEKTNYIFALNLEYKL